MTTLNTAISDELHQVLPTEADLEHVSVYALIARSLRASIALPLLRMNVDQRASHGNWEDFDRITARVPDVPPVQGDEK